MTKLSTVELLKVCVLLELLLLDVDGETNYGNSMSHVASPSWDQAVPTSDTSKSIFSPRSLWLSWPRWVCNGNQCCCCCHFIYSTYIYDTMKNQSKWYSAYHTSFVWKVLVWIFDILSSLTIFLGSPSFTVNGHAVCAMRHFVVDARDLIIVPIAVYALCNSFMSVIL